MKPTLSGLPTLKASIYQDEPHVCLAQNLVAKTPDPDPASKTPQPNLRLQQCAQNHPSCTTR